MMYILYNFSLSVTHGIEHINTKGVDCAGNKVYQGCVAKMKKKYKQKFSYTRNILKEV